MATIKGLDKLIKKLDNIQKGTSKRIEQVLDDTARRMKNTADEKMREVSSGNKYIKPSGKEHTASRAGDYPNVDTGTLVNSVFYELMKGKLTAKFGSKGVPYAKMLEYGTSRMAARPWLKPTFDKHYPEVAPAVDKIIKEVLKRG